MMMETLDSGIGSRSPTPDINSIHSQTNSSKVTKVTTHTNHINNNSHNSSGNASSAYCSSKTKPMSEKGEVSSSVSSSSISSTNQSLSSSSSTTSSTDRGNSNNTSSGSNNHGNNTPTSNKTYRDYNNRHSGHGQYKKYGNHQNHHYGYANHNGHYQRYNNGNGHRNYGNKHYHNSSNYHHNNHNHYNGQNYHHQYSHHHNNSNNGNGGNNQNGGSHSNSHHQANHGNNHVVQNQQPGQQYYNHSGAQLQQHYQHHHNNHHFHNQHSNNQHHHQQHRNHPPQVFISPNGVDSFSWPARRGEENSSNTNWSSPNVGEGGGATTPSSSVQISLNLPALKQGFYSPSPQNVSPATSPATTDSSDAYSNQDDTSVGGTAGSAGSSTTGPATSIVRQSNLSTTVTSSTSVDTVMQYGTSCGNTVVDECPPTSMNGSSIGSHMNGTTTAGYQYAQYHPHTGFFTYPGAGHQHLNGTGNGRAFHHHPHHHLISQNLGLLMPADSSYSMGKADSSNGSDKTLEWSDDGTLISCSNIGNGERGDEYGNTTVNGIAVGTRCPTPEFYYTPYTIPTSTPFTTTNKKRFYNGSGTAAGKLSQAVQNQRFHQYPRKMAYHLAGIPREWLDDLDPEEYVRAFSKFGEVKERPEAMLKYPQSDSLSEGIWLKFVANQQTTETFRKKMELWRDVYQIIRSLNHNSHFKHDPRNFPTFGLQVVGSTMSGFGSNTSDVDMCLLVRGSDVDQRYEAVDKLQVLFGALSATQWLDNAEIIYAKVPILKFRDPKRSLEVDLNCNNYVGIRNTHLLYCYSQADWRLKPLVLVVKLWAHYHGINDAKNMTISSYSFVLMVIHFLQSGLEEPVLPILQQTYPEKFSNTSSILSVKINEVLPPWTSKNTESIGNLLIQFLEYYAKHFDYSENAVSVRTGRTIPIKQAAAYKSLKNDPHQWKYLCIEEPFDRTNTARSVYDRDTFDKILGVFEISYERLQASRNLESIFTPISESEIHRAMSSNLIR